MNVSVQVGFVVTGISQMLFTYILFVPQQALLGEVQVESSTIQLVEQQFKRRVQCLELQMQHLQLLTNFCVHFKVMLISILTLLPLKSLEWRG